MQVKRKQGQEGRDREEWEDREIVGSEKSDKEVGICVAPPAGETWILQPLSYTP